MTDYDQAADSANAFIAGLRARRQSHIDRHPFADRLQAELDARQPKRVTYHVTVSGDGSSLMIKYGDNEMMRWTDELYSYSIFPPTIRWGPPPDDETVPQHDYASFITTFAPQRILGVVFVWCIADEQILWFSQVDLQGSGKEEFTRTGPANPKVRCCPAWIIKETTTP